MALLMIRLEAPLMSFGGVMVDQHGPTNRFPGLAMLTGLFGNALGWDHGDFDSLQHLQARVRFAARWDLEPEPLLDYHTVDLGQPKMRGYVNGFERSGEPRAWTTRGVPEGRGRGDATKDTHIRYRHYWANGVMTVAVELLGGEHPDLSILESALNRPARPLFIGRKACLPSAPLSLGKIDAENVLEAISAWPADHRTPADATDYAACWPADLRCDYHHRVVSAHDLRDWRNQIHGGARAQCEGRIPRNA